MTTIVKHNFIYHPEEKTLEVKKEVNIWEGVPKNLVPQVVNILRYPTLKEKIIALHLISHNIFHHGLIAQILKVTNSTVSYQLRDYYQSL